MKDHWKQLLANLKYKRGESIIDIGGSMDPVPIANVIVDIVPPHDNLKRFRQIDITSQALPFKEKEFDICICSQTLEDLTSPRLILGEMQRVAKRGVIEVPHKWLIEQHDANTLLFTPKIQYMLMRHPIPKWNGIGNISFYWKDKFEYGILYDIDERMVDINFRDFREKNRQYWE